MKRVLSYAKKLIKPMIIGPAFKIIETFFELLTPFIVAKLIDEGITHEDTSLIFKFGIILCIFAVVGFLFTMLCQYLAARTQEQYGTALRHDLFKHIQSLEIEQTQAIGSNSLITRMTSDIYQVQAGVEMLIRMSPRAPFLLIGSALMTYLISSKLSLIFLLIIPLIVIVFILIMRQTIPTYQKVQQEIDHIGLLTNENLSGARVIRAFSKQKSQYEKFEKQTNILKKFSLYAGKFEAMLNPSTQLIVSLAIAGIIYFGKFEVNIGTLTQGEIIAIVNYIMQISLALIILVNLSITFSRAYTSAGRIEEVFAITPLYNKKKQTVNIHDEISKKTSILFENVTFTYPDAQIPMLKDISFALRKNGTLGIIGSTGSGKSTLIKLLGKFYQPTSGEIILDGKNLSDYSPELLHKKIQIVFQQATLFKGTIAENLRMGNPQASDETLWKSLEIAQAKEFVSEKPDGLYTQIEQGGKNLSGGQRQRLTIARGIVVQPEIIVFDDTSSALDYATDSKLRLAIQNLPMTIITVSQRISAIKDCEQIIVLNEGKINALGTHEHLLESSEIYRAIAKSQDMLEVK